MSNIHKVILVCRLKEILTERNISVNRLSREIQERRPTINDLVNNVDMDRRQIPARLIAKLCYYLNISPSDLFEVTIHKDVNNRN